MSAIYGVIYDHKEGDYGQLEKMQDGYKDCKIDRFSNLVKGNVMMGCAHQYLLPESEREVLPEETFNYIYTADAMLDNKDELCQKLQLPMDTPDGKVLFEAFVKWKTDIGKHVLGVFAACFYQKDTKTAYLVTDQTSSRCVNYYVNKDGFFFSTTIRPILNAVDEKIELSKKWICMCESNCSADLLMVPDLTAFEGVFQLEAGCYVKYCNGEIQKKEYWNLGETIKKQKVSDEQGLKIFRNTFKKCVKDVLRSKENTGITLSSGLDSSSVACVAVNELLNQGKKLHSYTSVPIEGYQNSDNPYLVENEEFGVRRIGKEYPDIIMKFINCPTKNAFSDLENLIGVLECPYKSGVNLVWLDEIYRVAREDGCKMILKGQFGNSTISYGTLMTTVYQSLKGFHFVTAAKEINKFGKKNKIGRKNVCRIIYKAYKENRKSPQTDPFEEGFTKSELIEKYEIKKYFDDIEHTESNCWVDTQEERYGSIYSRRILAHLGAFDTKLGLKHGIIVRDPSKDIRIMKLCMELPITCFAGNGYERRLVREGMQGIVPMSVLTDTNHRGRQGADFVYRLKYNWDEIKDYVMGIFDNESIYDYVDKAKVMKLKDDILNSKNLFDGEDTRWAVKLLVLGSLSEFLNQWK